MFARAAWLLVVARGAFESRRPRPAIRPRFRVRDADWAVRRAAVQRGSPGETSQTQ